MGIFDKFLKPKTSTEIVKYGDNLYDFPLGNHDRDELSKTRQYLGIPYETIDSLTHGLDSNALAAFRDYVNKAALVNERSPELMAAIDQIVQAVDNKEQLYQKLVTHIRNSSDKEHKHTLENEVDLLKRGNSREYLETTHGYNINQQKIKHEHDLGMAKLQNSMRLAQIRQQITDRLNQQLNDDQKANLAAEIAHQRAVAGNALQNGSDRIDPLLTETPLKGLQIGNKGSFERMTADIDRHLEKRGKLSARKSRSSGVLGSIKRIVGIE